MRPRTRNMLCTRGHTLELTAQVCGMYLLQDAVAYRIRVKLFSVQPLFVRHWFQHLSYILMLPASTVWLVAADGKTACRLRPPRIPKGLVSWVRVILDIPDEHFARIAGFDGLAYVRYLGLCMRISASILCVTVIPLFLSVTSGECLCVFMSQLPSHSSYE